MQRLFLLIFGAFLFLSPNFLWAQPSNDDCDGAINIPNVTNFCSSAGAYSNVGATPSGFGPAGCWSNTGNDVWYSFKATATDVTITIKGNTPQASGGTMVSPQVALYLGSCNGTINELECKTSPNGFNLVEAYQGGLFVGSTYLIRVQGANNNSGTFQICINNYNPPVNPTSDCPTASLLCDKSPFVVQQIEGPGADSSELDIAPCFIGGSPGNNETNSTWFKWTCSQSGTLTFSLTPLNVTDDLDFILYRLPNGINNCTQRVIERCMAAGSDPSDYPTPCHGPTGLRASSSDISENSGCIQGQDNFLAPLNMIAGQSYALVINNFSEAGNGCAIEWGGTGQFQGPEATFVTDPMAVCIGVPVSVTSTASFALGSVTEQNFSFGANATPGTANGAGPHTVQFNESGLQSVVFTVKTNLGCKVTKIQDVLVYPKVEVDTFIAMPDCNGGTNGAVTISNILSGTPPYQYSWNGAPFTTSPSLTGLSNSTVNLIIQDANNCQTALDISVSELELTIAPDIIQPTCAGFSDGQVTLNVTNGTGPYQFNFGAGFQASNIQSNLPAGNYTFYGTDADLCQGEFLIEILDHPPLVLDMDTINISCFGADNGVGIALASGGVGNYTYQWTDNQTTAEATGLAPGQYNVTVLDGNNCLVNGAVFITQPLDLFVNFIDALGVICFGDATGTVFVDGGGGVGPYQFGIDGDNFVPSDTLTNVVGGDHWVVILDANGCRDSVLAYVPTPPPLIVTTDPDTTLNLGFQAQITTVSTPFGRPVTYAWMPPIGLSCIDCAEPVVTGIGTTTYYLTITDEDNCMATDSVRIIVVKNRPIYIPNIIQPDNPTQFGNDKFTLFAGPAAERIELLRIYDRWGELLYQERDMPLGADSGNGWDGTFRGKKVNPGVYAFVATVRFVDQVVIEYTGDVTVKR
jgi:hypothetical protein